MDGVDVSAFQSLNGTPIAWQTVKADGKELAMVRASDGVGITAPGLANSVDVYYSANEGSVQAVSLYPGAYHVLEPNQSVQGQAEVFLQTIGAGQRLLGVDVEPIWQAVSTPDQCNQAIADFSAIVSRELNRGVMRYCDEARATWLGIEPEWLAAYTTASAPPTPCLLWQFGQDLIPGIGSVVDLDVWLSDLLTLHTWSGEFMQNVTKVNKPPVAILGSLDGLGYAIVCSDGGVFTFGDMPFEGSAGALPLVEPIVSAALTPSGKGYWLAAADGGIFSYGDAAFFGSMGGKPLAQPIIQMTAMPDGKGYRLLANDGGVFCFGSAQYFGRVEL